MARPTGARRELRGPAGWVRRHWVATLVVCAMLGVGLGQGYVALAGGAEASPEGAVRARSAGQLTAEFGLAERGAPVEMAGTTLTGADLSLADSRGRLVVVNVWGSWCAPCRKEAPVLASAATKYAGQVDFVGVNVRDNRASAIAFEKRFKVPYPSIADEDGKAVLALNGSVPANAVPATLVLDRQGRVAARVLGAVREATLRAVLTKVLAEGHAR